MPRSRSVAVLVGSLRAGSFSLKLAKALIQRAPDNLACRLIEIGDLPLYNEDSEAERPASWARLRDAVRAVDAVLFVTPEYNRSIPGCLKNALDVGSRPANQSVWAGKPAAVVSVTPYKLGAFGANHALRQTFVFLDMPVMQQPEAYIGGAGELFDEAGALKSEDTGKFLGNFMERFAAWIETVSGKAGDHDFKAFMQARERAAAAYVDGDAGPLDAMVSPHDPASFFHPKGAVVTGAEAVKQRYDDDARSFAPGGHSRLEVLNATAGGELAYWTGLQHAEAILGGQSVPTTLRITELFRLEEGAWKLVHRHADVPPKDGQPPAR